MLQQVVQNVMGTCTFHTNYHSVDVARKLQREGIHTTLIPDSGVGYFMHKVNLVYCIIIVVNQQVIMGAEVVVETGGIFNRLGSLQVGVMAKAFNVPVYIAAGNEWIESIMSRKL